MTFRCCFASSTCIHSETRLLFNKSTHAPQSSRVSVSRVEFTTGRCIWWYFKGRVTAFQFYLCPGVNKNTCHVKFVFRIVKFVLKIHKGRCFSVCRAAVWRLRPLLLPPCPFAMLIMPIFESARSRNPALKASYNVFRKLNLSSDRGLQYGTVL